MPEKFADSDRNENRIEIIDQIYGEKILLLRGVTLLMPEDLDF